MNSTLADWNSMSLLQTCTIPNSNKSKIYKIKSHIACQIMIANLNMLSSFLFNFSTTVKWKTCMLHCTVHAANVRKNIATYNVQNEGYGNK